jgi:hypothetical protein
MGCNRGGKEKEIHGRSGNLSYFGQSKIVTDDGIDGFGGSAAFCKIDRIFDTAKKEFVYVAIGLGKGIEEMLIRVEVHLFRNGLMWELFENG